MLFRWGKFTSASGLDLDWKIECDALTDGDWVCIANACAPKIGAFGSVIGVPRGGIRFAAALAHHAQPNSQRLLVADDVWTTGKSMQDVVRREITERGVYDWRGVVAFARGKLPPHVLSFARINV